MMKFNVTIVANGETRCDNLPADFQGRTLTEARHLIRGVCDAVRYWGKPGTHLRITFGPSDHSRPECVVNAYSDGTCPSIPLRHSSWPKEWSDVVPVAPLMRPSDEDDEVSLRPRVYDDKRDPMFNTYDT